MTQNAAPAVVSKRQEDQSTKLKLQQLGADSAWERVGGDLEKGVAKLAEELKVEPKELGNELLALAESEIAEAARGRHPILEWFGRRCLEVVPVAVALGLLFNVVRPLNEVAVVVKRPGGLRPFDVIGPDDVTVESRGREAGTFAVRDGVVGRFMLTFAKQGAVLHAADVSTNAFGVEVLRGRTVLEIEIELGQTRPVEGEHVALALVRRHSEGPRSAIVGDALVVGVGVKDDKKTIAASIAVPDSEVSLVASLLGDSRVLLLRNLREPPQPTPRR